MFPMIEGDTHVLCENSALAIVIHERAILPCIRFEKDYVDFNWVYCSIYKHKDYYIINYTGRCKREQKFLYENASKLNELLGINIFEEWMIPYFESVLVSLRMRGLTGR